jgi:hypothetical protein
VAKWLYTELDREAQNGNLAKVYTQNSEFSIFDGAGTAGFGGSRKSSTYAKVLEIVVHWKRALWGISQELQCQGIADC